MTRLKEPSGLRPVRVAIRAGKSKSLEKAKRREKAEKGGKSEFDLQLDFWQKSTSLVEMS